MTNKLENEYFDWLYNSVCGENFSEKTSFRKLLMYLHTIEFRYSIARDANRAEDGKNLRYEFSIHNGYEDVQDSVLDILDGPCSVFEMLVALAKVCEEIMDDPDYGNRTGQWFWKMITNLGLGSMFDNNFDKEYVDMVINRFLDREYEPNGKGGLFTIDGEEDLRKVEIWYQLCWYLDSILF